MVAVVLYILVAARFFASFTLFLVTPPAFDVVGSEVLGSGDVIFAMVLLLSCPDMY